MSIYDDQFNDGSESPPQQPPPEKAQLAASIPEAEVAEEAPAQPETSRRRGCGCGSCLVAVLVTGAADTHVIEMARKMSVEFLSKPFRGEALASALASALESQRRSSVGAASSSSPEIRTSKAG